MSRPAHADAGSRSDQMPSRRLIDHQDLVTLQDLQRGGFAGFPGEVLEGRSAGAAQAVLAQGQGAQAQGFGAELVLLRAVLLEQTGGDEAARMRKTVDLLQPRWAASALTPQLSRPASKAASTAPARATACGPVVETERRSTM